MKRDLDFIREILLFIEKSNSTRISPNEFLQLTDNFDKICYHLYLLHESGYIQASNITCMGANTLNIWYIGSQLQVAII